jgi:leucyl aminopeptidase
MELRFETSAPASLDVDLLAVLVADPAALPDDLIQLDEQLGGPVRRELDRAKAKADASWTVSITGAAAGPGRILLVGFGPVAKTGRGDSIRIAGAKIAGAARGMKAESVAVAAPESAADTQALVEGISVGAFRIHKYRNEVPSDDGDDEAVGYEGPTALLISGTADDDVRAAAERGRVLGEAQNWARDLANAPANLMTPIILAAEAEQLAEQHEHLTFSSLGREEIEDEGMGMFAAVAQGADDDPRLIVLEWNPPGAEESDDDRLALVGKAVTFDTGGYSIKPGGSMVGMKMDKSGGCAVLGAMRAIAEVGVDRRVVAIVGATMNMIDGKSYRPDDVVTAMDGTTVEIVSTDAEGRLVLGDCISYARSLGCGAIVEMSTLTGAMVVALGHRFAGAIAEPGSALLAQVVAAGERTGDHAWPLPIHSEYTSNLKTDSAEFRNSGSRDAGALSAGGFLGHFAKDTPFVHLDVAGAGMLPKPRLWYGTKGASGWGVRLLVDLAQSRTA